MLINIMKVKFQFMSLPPPQFLFYFIKSLYRHFAHPMKYVQLLISKDKICNGHFSVTFVVLVLENVFFLWVLLDLWPWVYNYWGKGQAVWSVCVQWVCCEASFPLMDPSVVDGCSVFVCALSTSLLPHCTHNTTVWVWKVCNDHLMRCNAYDINGIISLDTCTSTTISCAHSARSVTKWHLAVLVSVFRWYRM